MVSYNNIHHKPYSTSYQSIETDTKSANQHIFFLYVCMCEIHAIGAAYLSIQAWYKLTYSYCIVFYTICTPTTHNMNKCNNRGNLHV